MLKSIGNPGRLDCKLTLMQPTNNKDGIGDTITTFSAAGTVRAERVFYKAHEQFEASQQTGQTIETFRMRDYRTLYAIDQTWQLVYDGDTYEVTGVERGGRKNFLLVTAMKRDNG